MGTRKDRSVFTIGTETAGRSVVTISMVRTSSTTVDILFPSVPMATSWPVVLDSPMTVRDGMPDTQGFSNGLARVPSKIPPKHARTTQTSERAEITKTVKTFFEETL